jgi:DNA-binding NtrC family response regulator
MGPAATGRTPEPRRIAIITGDSGVAKIEPFLRTQFEVRVLPRWSALAAALSEGPLDAVLFDLDAEGIPQAQGLAQLAELRRQNHDLALLAITRAKDPHLKLLAEQAELDELLVTPVEFRRIRQVLQQAVERHALEIEMRRLGAQISSRYSFGELIGGSEAMRRVYDAIVRVAKSDTTVIIRGESGTGKELVAKCIVSAGPRREQPFISLNCAALPEALIEAELFGHEKGAFTGAHTARPGQIELADGGTLFLDEIATLGIDLQTKLLRVLEERLVTRLGGRTGKHVDFRLLTATNENLEEAVRAGRFREDLYYRINVVPIFIPPLRERRGDIALLADHYLRLYSAANRIPTKRLDTEALEIIEEYHWPGNVRELENMMQRLVLMSESQVITAKDLPQQLIYTSTARQEALLIPEGGIDFAEEMARIETAYLEAALRRSAGKKVTAAALLRLKPQQMKYLCRKYGIGIKSGPANI